MRFTKQHSTTSHKNITFTMDCVKLGNCFVTSCISDIGFAVADRYTGCNRRNGPDFGRVFLRSNYTDITQNTYIRS